MKILIINKSDTIGGAAIAAHRLKNALQANGHDVKMLVQEKLSDDATVYSTTNSKFKKYYNLLLFVIERLFFLFFEKSKAVRFAFSPAIAGENISKHSLVKQADVIHIHWFNQGFLSLKNLNQLLKLNKKTVWTLHDMWAFTGGCHYAGECKNYQNNCGNCKFLKKPGKKDLSNKILKKKEKIFKNPSLQIATCSKWLANIAKSSNLLHDFSITPIPNPIDTNIFCPKEKNKLRKRMELPLDKRLILFGAANVMDKRKGFAYLIGALDKLKQENPELTTNTEILIFGKSSKEFLAHLPLKVNNLGLISGEENIADVYAAADVFVLPSLEDNLPNTVMESLACGTPVVAYNIGGIPEMIDHKQNGYLAEYKSIEDLKKGLVYILCHREPAILSKNSFRKAAENYSQKEVETKYMSVYYSCLSNKK